MAEIDLSRKNDPVYMLDRIRFSNINYRYLGEELRNSPDFILDLIRYEDFKYANTLFRHLPDTLINNPDFVISYVSILRQRTVKYAIDGDETTIIPESLERFKTVFNKNIRLFLNKDIFMNNESFWSSIYDLGANTKAEKNSYYFNAYPEEYNEPEYRKSIKEKVLSEISTITIEGFKKLVRTSYREDPEFMFDLVVAKPELFDCLGDDLKNNKYFLRRLIGQNPEIKPYIAREFKKEIEARKKRQKGSTKRVKTINEKKLDHIKEEYRRLGKKHPNIVLIQNYINSKLTKKLYCFKNNIDSPKLDSALSEFAQVYPSEYITPVNEYIARVDKKFNELCESITQDLLSDDPEQPKHLIEYSKRENYKDVTFLDILERCKNPEQKRKLYVMMLNAMQSNSISTNGYKRLFWINYDTSPNRIGKNIRLLFFGRLETFYKDNSLEMPYELIKKARMNSLTMLADHEEPYNRASFINSSFSANGNKVFLSSNMLGALLKYLEDNDEDICKMTVQNAVKRIANGELIFTGQYFISKNEKETPSVSQEDEDVPDM